MLGTPNQFLAAVLIATVGARKACGSSRHHSVRDYLGVPSMGNAPNPGNLKTACAPNSPAGFAPGASSACYAIDSFPLFSISPTLYFAEHAW